MSITEIKVGDRLDFPARELHNGEVLKVGRATVWLVFAVPGRGNFPVSADPHDLQPHLDPRRIRIGEFVLRDEAAGKVWIESARTGEAMQTDTAKLESHLARFWNKEF
jgi:hypothetical protein